MAKLWKPHPKAPLEGNERVGRRIFDEPRLIGVGEQPDLGVISVEHFREKRGCEVSLDRLGRTSIEPKVRNYLLPRCEWQACKFSEPKGFNGWAVIKIKDLANNSWHLPIWQVCPSPHGLENGEPFSDNDFHAHAACSDQTNDLQNAINLRFLFERHGVLEVVEMRRDEINGGLIGKIVEVLKTFTHWLKYKW